MKVKNMRLSLFLFFLLIFQANPLSTTVQDIIHDKSQLPKVYTLEDGSVLVLSTLRGEQAMLESKLDKQGRPLYGNSTYGLGYTASSQLIQLKSVNGSEPNYLLFYHNKENLKGAVSKENILEFNHGRTKNTSFTNSIYQQKSIVALNNGKVVLAGLNKKAGYGAETSVDLKIYDPETQEFGTGVSFAAYSDYVSCFELKTNDLYCVYSSLEHVYVNKLKIMYISVNGNTLTIVNKGDQVIKSFYTDFNFLKAIPFNENEAIVLFQTGNGGNKPKYGNEGKDLYYYHLVVNKKDITVKRYELLYENCKHYDDPENYNADIAVLSQKRIYAACETESGRFRGFIIYPDKAEWDEFYFNNFEAESVENPVFAKFDKSLGIFYGYNTVNENAKVAFHLMNYPDCFNYREREITVPKHFSISDVDLSGKVFMANPYPASRASEPIKIRFESNSNISMVTKEGQKLEEGKDYEPNLNLKITPGNTDGAYAIKYTATRQDNLDGLIIGRTCNINFNIPKCLDRCYSCTKTGNEEHHYCLGCAEGKYYEEEDETTVNDGWGKPHNCPNCNISCSSCFGAAMMKPTQTTNCKKCDYENGYYHYEHDNRTCISYETQEAWEAYFNHSIYLDSTPGPDRKWEWRWKFCHKHCKKCHLPGTDENNNCDVCDEENGFYFWCNQTVGNGIPGTCHDKCVNNGFFLKKADDGMTKCCPCLDNCKVCQNETICDNCYPPFFRIPSGEECAPDCNNSTCWAEDRELWECVNCKTRYSVEKYNLNKTCVDKIPFIPFLNKYHHIVDDQCNILHGCKDGCFKCDEWYTEKCTKCFPEYYKEDFYSLEQPHTFRCFKEKECQGIERYQHDISLQVGGVPKLLAGENVCYNCRLREGNYRQVENDFTCGPRKKRTYIAIPYYNKLGQCYARCASCDDWGNSCFMNCTSCRDPSLYDLKTYTWNTSLGNCERYTHKCKSLPYYHDYDLAAEYGIDEDNCGQDCDVCLTNMTCTERFPFFVLATRECVESCPITDILGKTCLMNHTNAGFILLQNPFQLEDLYRPINQTVNIQQLISSKIFETVVSKYNIDVNSAKKTITNVLGKGEIYNLPESQIIIGNNISIELTSVSLELQKLAKLLENAKNSQQTTYTAQQTSILNISKCESALKTKYGLSNEEQLMIIKSDIIKQLKEYTGTSTDYQLFSTSLGAFLPLTECQKPGIGGVEISNPFNISNLQSAFQFRYGDAFTKGYDVFSSDSPFYTDVCTPFTNENGNDVLLDERRSDYFNENLNLCDDGCTFVSYNPSTHLYTCSCPIKGTNNTKIDSKELDESFYKKHKNSNIEVIKCASQVFSSEGQKKNFGSYILMACIVSFIGVAVFYFVKGKSKVDEMINKISSSSIKANPPKPSEVPATSKEIAKRPNNGDEDGTLSDYELNSADFDTAKDKDNRGFLQYYWSLIKSKQICIFSFYTSDDYNIKSIKIALFILFVAFYFAFTALFFNDSIMRNIYIYKGNTDAAVHIPNIILSSICSLIMMYIVRFVSLTERDITKIKHGTLNKENTKKLMKIKAIILFAVSALLIGLCWYYVAAFCAVFKNSQGHYLINVLFSFIVCNIWPFVTSLIPPILRRKALDNDNKCLYKASQIIAYI